MPIASSIIAASIAAGGALGSSALSRRGSGGAGGGNGQFAPPIYPELQQQWGNYLQGQIGQGVNPYSGQLNASQSPYLNQAGQNLQSWASQPGMDTSGVANRFMAQPSVGAGQFVREMLPEGGSSAFQNLRGDIYNAAQQSTGQPWLNSVQNAQGALGNIAQTGIPINSTDAWQAMIAAQERNLAQRGAQVGEKTAGPGGRFSSGYQEAQTNYFTQAAKDQNALLAEMTRQSGEAAAGRRLGASQSLLNVPGLYQQGYGQQQQTMLGLGQLQAGQEGRDIQRAQAMMQGWGLDITKGQAGADIAQRQQMLGPAGFNQQLQLGQYLTGLEQGNLGREQQNWAMSQPWANPYLQFINQASQNFARPTGMPPQPSPWQSLIGAGTNLAGQWFGRRPGNNGMPNVEDWGSSGYGLPGGQFPQGQVPPWMYQQPTY